MAFTIFPNEVGTCVMSHVVWLCMHGTGPTAEVNSTARIGAEKLFMKIVLLMCCMESEVELAGLPITIDDEWYRKWHVTSLILKNSLNN